ncbi:AraC family transcriptional regulator [Paractinoplanes rishiriensis]|uniref:HTH araC/xylS-type domain-containing protein n=1 Tax=Paractinoplanes rishiriensis TaxID=1050105 RepID=A0A919JY93_9ACTN|nr:AraC family transcriptional regulator [Actinoplanes rishiriensis]GIE97441.1 hypothetical protein Ari01nite_49060 [Actinoplanes rishiriensis]
MAIVLETTDRDDVRRFLRDSCGAFLLRVSGDSREPVRVSRCDLGPIQLLRIAGRLGLEVGGPLSAYAVALVNDGEVICRSGPQDCRHRAGEVFLAGQPGQQYRAVLHRPDLRLALLDPELVGEIVGRPPRPLRFTGGRPVSAEAAASWRTTYDYVHAALVDQPGAAGDPMVADSLARMLAAVALTTFPHNGVRPPPPDDRRPVTLHEAVDFIDTNAHRDIDLGAIAGAAHVTVRALQLSFRRHLDTTPMTHLRRVRLAHAHRELLGADPATGSVSEVAARWGFSSHSRFTAMYHATYGCSPSATLGSR